MKVVIAGGSGQVGQILSRYFAAGGHEVVILTRRPRRMGCGRAVQWDGEGGGTWTRELDGCDILIGLAGRSVNCRYTPENRHLIKASRVNSVRVLGGAIQRVSSPPRLWLQASTATIYAHTYGAAHTETCGTIGGSEPDAADTWNFSIDVATAWEEALRGVGSLPNTRTVLLRSAMTMSPDAGGVFDTFLRLVRLGLGGTIGDGRQFVSWIHEKDFVRAVEWLIGNSEFAGIVNLAAPTPIPNAQFMRILRQAWGMPAGLPASGFILGFGAWLMQTETELVLKSRRVVPERLLQGGFSFSFPEWEGAAEDLCQQIKNRAIP